MPVLALDTSADISVCLLSDPVPGGPLDYQPVLAERRVTEQRRHAELLAPLITEVLDEAGFLPRDLTSVVVGTGPAPFTGLRAGLVTARTLAFAVGIPVLGVCSLDVLAAQTFHAGLAQGDVVVVTDARRREVYVARYREARDETGHDVVAVVGPAVQHPVDLAAELAQTPATVVGPGAALYPEHLTPAPDGPVHLDPAVLARLAHVRTVRGLPQPTEPLYLRRPDVHPAAARKRATG